METLLDDYYKQSLHVSRFIARKIELDAESLQLVGVAQSGKTTLIKQYLLGCKKSSYLYLDCRDLRIEDEALSRSLPEFCLENGIEILALDNYRPSIRPPGVRQLIVSGEYPFDALHVKRLRLTPLDYEEFLAYEPKFDSTVFNHFLQLGGYPVMHMLGSETRLLYLQQTLQSRLTPLELDIVTLVAKSSTLKLSAFSIFERLKIQRRISKDMLYKTLNDLLEKRYLYDVRKFAHERAVKKIYLCDIAIKNALSLQKHFGRLFENLVFLEMIKRNYELYYLDAVDFYLPRHRRIVLCMPFAAPDALFKRIESIESFIIEQGILHVEVVTVGSEGHLQHPFVSVEMLPFGEWAITQGESL